MTIGYKDGYLYDLDTSYGYGPGQTAWQDRVRSWYEGVQKEYLREREEELKREENTPSKFEMAVKANEDYMRETFGEGSAAGNCVSCHCLRGQGRIPGDRGIRMDTLAGGKYYPF